METVIKEFLAESIENLDQLDLDLVTLEKEPGDREVLGRVFRTIHTIKGTCGFLAFGTLEEVTHAGESVLSHLRDGTLELRPDIMAVLLALVDAVRNILATISETGHEGGTTFESLVKDLRACESEAGEKKKAPEVVDWPVAAAKRARIELAPDGDAEGQAVRSDSPSQQPAQPTGSTTSPNPHDRP